MATIPAAKLVEAIFIYGIPKVIELIAIWKKGGELTLDEADALIAKFDKRAADYLTPTQAGATK